MTAPYVHANGPWHYGYGLLLGLPIDTRQLDAPDFACPPERLSRYTGVLDSTGNRTRKRTAPALPGGNHLSRARDHRGHQRRHRAHRGAGGVLTTEGFGEPSRPAASWRLR